MLIKIIPYSLIFLIIFTLSYCSFFKDHKMIIRGGWYFVIILLALFSGLRNELVDPDYLTYKNIYNQISDTQSIFGKMHVEYGYRSLNYLASVILSLKYSSFLLCFLFLSLFIIALTYVKISPYPLISLLLYFVHYYLARDFIAIRSAISYAIVIYAIVSFSMGRNRLKYFLYILGASTFHKSAILSLPLPFIYPIFSNLSFRCYSIVGLFVSLTLAGVLDKNRIVSILSYFFNEKSIFFQTYFVNPSNSFDLGILNLVNLKNISILLLLNVITFNKKYSFIIFSFSMGCFMLIALHSLGVIAARSLSQWVFLDTILIVILLNAFKIEQRLFLFLLVSFYAFFMLLSNLSRPDAFFYKVVML